MPLDFKLLISLLSDFCCLIKVYMRLLGRPVLELLSCWSITIDSMYETCSTYNVTLLNIT